jgi:ATP-dependent Lhr-like helicase
VTAALAPFAPPTAAWFAATFAAPTPPQVQAWPAIARGEHVLLVAPTGSGKTLAAFLAALDRLLFTPRPDGARGTRVVYVSPIKALAVDVERNLMAPLAGIRAAAEASGRAAAPVTVAVRSGDTSARDRRAIARGDADVLITTPESLYLMLTSAARAALRTVEVVIVDEIHALVGNERGAHLALSLERLELHTGRPLQRVGLSATQRPLAEVARFLAGARPVTIVDAAGPKQLDLTIEMPFAPTAAGTLTAGPAASNWDRVFPRLVELVRAHTAGVRERAPHRAHGRAQRRRRRGDRPRPPRLARAGAAHDRRRAAQGRLDPVPRRDELAGARHRHGRDRLVVLIGRRRRPAGCTGRARRPLVGAASAGVLVSSTGVRARRWPRRCGRARSRPAATCATRSTCWPSSWWRCARSTPGTSTSCTRR